MHVPLLVGTLGKAFGCFGAFVAGERDLIEYILQRARSYVFTTALPPAVAAAARVALRIARETAISNFVTPSAAITPPTLTAPDSRKIDTASER